MSQKTLMPRYEPGAQVQLPHFPQKVLNWGTERMIWSFEVPGRISNKSTTQGWPEMASLFLAYHQRVSGSKTLANRISQQICPMSQKTLMPRYEPGAQVQLPHYPQKVLNWGTERMIWGFEVPGRISTKSTTQGWPEMATGLQSS